MTAACHQTLPTTPDPLLAPGRLGFSWVAMVCSGESGSRLTMCTTSHAISKAAAAADLTWELDREGANHSVYKLDGLTIPVPRHNEINERTAEGIFKECGPKLQEGWWK